MISAEDIKKLREKTGLSIAECKNALEGAEGNEQKALELLEKRGAEIAGKKADRQIKAGIIVSYIHANKQIGVLLEMDCETDFVARNENFQTLAHEVCLQIAAANPQIIEELLEQSFIKNSEKKVQNLINESVGKLGENIKVGRFIRFEI